jgi:hypothetical protein
LEGNNMRNSQYDKVSKYLEALSNDDLVALLKQGTPVQSGWATTVKLEIEGIPIFVKQVPLNTLEGKSENIGSTENLFNLPIYYQYGVGSGAFSVWREVSAHEMTTEWVLKCENLNFPLMYHWRILDNVHDKKPFDEANFKKHISYWENSPEIGERVIANHEARQNVVIFMEYIPDTLKSWLSKESEKGNEAIDKAIKMVEKDLQETSRFLCEKKMLHFDAHFHNVLTDGERLYFADFGLSISSQFKLSKEEFQFFQLHSNYDHYYVATVLTNWIVSHSFGKENVDKVLQMYLEGKTPLLVPNSLTPFLERIIKRYAALTLKMNHFFESLIKVSKKTPYPADDLQQIWTEISTNN